MLNTEPTRRRGITDHYTGECTHRRQLYNLEGYWSESHTLPPVFRGFYPSPLTHRRARPSVLYSDLRRSDVIHHISNKNHYAYGATRITRMPPSQEISYHCILDKVYLQGDENE